jgi:hypothetical protein
MGCVFQTLSLPIFNTYGQYGGEYSDKSPCNEYATHPPVIVDERGDYYGVLTINEYNPKRTRSQMLQGWIARVCAGKK